MVLYENLSMDIKFFVFSVLPLMLATSYSFLNLKAYRIRVGPPLFYDRVSFASFKMNIIGSSKRITKPRNRDLKRGFGT